MKVVLFCGGQGMRLRDYSEALPKPMVPIGYRPILWYIMKYYAFFGHREFILCLGWKADVIKDYFLNYDECVSNDFVLKGGESVQLFSRDIADWDITFVDTGTAANIGERLRAVEPLLAGEETFLANYADGLTDMNLSELVKFHHEKEATATFMSVRPSQSFHEVAILPDGTVNAIRAISEADVWMNAGFFCFNQDIFRNIHDGEDLVIQPFERLIEQKKLASYQYNGFFGCMDTFKEKQMLDDRHVRGDTPWEIWNRPANKPSTSSLLPGEYNSCAWEPRVS